LSDKAFYIANTNNSSRANQPSMLIAIVFGQQVVYVSGWAGCFIRTGGGYIDSNRSCAKDNFTLLRKVGG